MPYVNLERARFALAPKHDDTGTKDYHHCPVMQTRLNRGKGIQ